MALAYLFSISYIRQPDLDQLPELTALVSFRVRAHVRTYMYRLRSAPGTNESNE